MTTKIYYDSIEHHILTKSTTSPYNYDQKSVEELKGYIREEVMKHPNTKLTSEEKEWLIELLLWEKLFPEEKPGFPGLRPSNPNHGHEKVAHNYLPSCRTCVEENLREEACPYVRLIACDKKVEHPVYKVRLGTEDFLGPDCPACYAEELDGRGKKNKAEGRSKRSGEE